MTDGPRMVMFTMAFHSGMGRGACEIVRAIRDVVGETTIFVAPPQDSEPGRVHRVELSRPATGGSRLRKLVGMARMNLDGALAIWRTVRRGDAFMMVDLYSTIPLSMLPAWAARLRGARIVLGLHDFYPHASRFPVWARWFERWFYRFAYRQFDLIAAMKPTHEPRLRTEAKVAGEKILVIEHGPFPVDGIRFPAEDAPTERILVHGALRANKMVLESIEAMPLLRAERPGAILRIAGAPRREESGYWARCRAALEGMEGVELTDRYVEDAEMPAVLSDVDVMLCPYDGFDSQSGVSVVAVCNGLPLAATPAAFVAGVETAAAIPVPVTAEGIAAALADFFRRPRVERLRRAAEARDRFMAGSQWVRSATAIVDTLEALYGVRLPRTETEEAR